MSTWWTIAAVVGWQLGRPARAFAGVAVRCPYGYPAVTEQAPRADDGTPFPTTLLADVSLARRCR